MSEYRHLQMKKAEKPDYLHRPFTSLDHHLGGASLIVVEFYVEPVRRGGVVV